MPKKTKPLSPRSRLTKPLIDAVHSLGACEEAQDFLMDNKGKTLLSVWRTSQVEWRKWLMVECGTVWATRQRHREVGTWGFICKCGCNSTPALNAANLKRYPSPPASFLKKLDKLMAKAEGR